ncbi:lytic transglycosylase domain-containing protein [Prescottella subtropica]|uniref:lytic transglycosylase domain-containing protein n=1 Tax=Prescottella subtropica TaxID=2545757 RepID=UPI0010F55E5C|nr:lytic transglycosylase domain-containing protein [Prescottella subtropica]
MTLPTAARRTVLALAAAAAVALTAACTTTADPADGTSIATATTTDAAPGAIDRAPAEFVTWIDSAPLPCPSSAEITREFIAAQLDIESGFDAAAVGPSGQAGAAQLLPNVAELHDADGNGTASPFDIGDAVHTLARLDCAIAERLTAANRTADAASIAAAFYAGIGGMDTADAREYARAVAARM